MSDPIVIVSAARTPIGALLGELSSIAATALGATALRACVERAGIAPDRIDEVLLGCVLPAGLGQAPARQALIEAGLPVSTGATTVSKVCGSGMKAAMLAHDLLKAGSAQVVLAGGMESMSRSPFLLPRMRAGHRFGHTPTWDHMALDGLEDAYERDAQGVGRSMGYIAEDCATQYGFTRDAQQQYAAASVERARAAMSDGGFEWELAPVYVSRRGAAGYVERDESPGRIDTARAAGLKPAFRPDGTITAATSSSISDGAAALALMRESDAVRSGATPLARIVAHATESTRPELFPVAPVGAIRRLLARAGWSAGSVDLYEINEAFAVVPMAAMHDLDLPHDRVNVHGGAIALGHPIGASGARVIVTLLGALRRRQARRGVASLCIGGGEATAMALEIV